MFLEPNPIRRDAMIQDLAQTSTIRRLHCRFQSHCLDIAAKNYWLGMSCEQCEVIAPLSPVEERSDIGAMANMWMETRFPRSRAL